LSEEILVNVTPPETRVAVVENAHDQTALIEAIPGPQIGSREPALQEMAKSLMPVCDRGGWRCRSRRP